VTLTVAILTAAGCAIFGFPFRFYQCWFSWSRWGANAGITIYLLLAGGGGGMIGWLAALGAHASPSSQPAVDGILYGFGGALAVRADFRAQRQHAPRQIREAASALGKGIEWVTGLLDEVTQRKAKSWLKTLNDDQLLAVAVDIIQEIDARPSSEIPAPTKKVMLRKITDAMTVVRSGAADDQRADARARLIQFGVVYFIGQHAAKPAVAPPGGLRPAKPTLMPPAPAH
jgi:hypothetical protein